MSEARQYEAALLAYQAAYAMRPASWLLINIGRVNQKLGKLNEAIASYRKFLAGDGIRQAPEMRSRAETFLAQAETELAKPPAAPIGEAEPPPAPLADKPAPPVATQPQPGPGSADRATRLVGTETRLQRAVYKRPWFIGLVSTAAAALVVGIVIGVSPRLDRPSTILYPMR
jgi:tetratricopeptide (TPR) repeat protein